jgi:hypothetical protein
MVVWNSSDGGSNNKAASTREIDLMARIIVTTDQAEQPGAPVLLDERVYSDHLSDNHCAAQLIERLGWAVNDAEHAESSQPVAH